MSGPEKPLRVSTCFKGDYLEAGDLDGRDVAVKIAAVIPPNTVICQASRKPIDKPIIQFEKARKALVLNKTNARIVRNWYGDDMTKWIGEAVTLYATTTRFGREVVPCIRVRAKKLKLPTE